MSDVCNVIGGMLYLWQPKDLLTWEECSDINDLTRVAKYRVDVDYDVLAMTWRPDSQRLLSGDTNNWVAVWDVTTSDKVKQQEERYDRECKGPVRGLCFDPRDELFISQCSDRTVKVFERCGKARKGGNSFKVAATLARLNGQNLFCDDAQYRSLFQRCCFSPDGALMVFPAGQVKSGDDMRFVVHVYSRYHYDKPAIELPCGPSPAICVEFCPMVYECEKGSAPWLDVAYKMVFAVATHVEVLVYDTCHLRPIARLAHLHCTPLSDLSWSRDGSVLMVASTDGYCTRVHFVEGELGHVVPLPPLEMMTPAPKPAPAAAAAVPDTEAVAAAGVDEAPAQKTPCRRITPTLAVTPEKPQEPPPLKEAPTSPCPERLLENE